MVTTLNKIRQNIEGFFKSHPQVNFCSYGTIEDYIAVDNKDYYAINIEFTDADVTGKFISYGFNITIADLINLNYPETEHDAISACMQIGNDFLGWLTGEDYTYTGSNYQVFREGSNPDMTAGVVLGFTIQVPAYLNECAVPK